MKSRFIAVLAVAVGLALAGSTFAQGRHDEKPHGMPKNPPAASSDEKASGPQVGGRHDERPHGMKKPAAKKDGSQPGDDKGAK